MAEKVYGICGTNKCRREVVSADNIKFLFGTTNALNGSGSNVYANVQFDYPEGYTSMNSVIIGCSVFILKSAAQGGATYTLGVDSFINYVEKDMGKIIIGFNGANASEFNASQFVMRVNLVLTKIDSDATHA